MPITVYMYRQYIPIRQRLSQSHLPFMFILYTYICMFRRCIVKWRKLRYRLRAGLKCCVYVKLSISMKQKVGDAINFCCGYSPFLFISFLFNIDVKKF